MNTQSGPRLSPSLSLAFCDMRPPFDALGYVEASFGTTPMSHPLAGILALARRSGCRTLVDETIKSCDVIEYDNAVLQTAYPRHTMCGLRRLSFWNSAFYDEAALARQEAGSLVGYAILKGDELGEPNRDHVWSVYEALIRQPSMSDTFVPRESTLAVQIGPRVFALTGILFCGQNGLSRKCAHTALRSFCSNALGRDVTFPEIDSVLGFRDASAIRMARGMSIADMTRVIDGVGLHSWVNVFGNSRTPAPLSLDEALSYAISSTSGAILGFETEHGIAHAVYIFGYTLSPFSLEHSAQRAYFLPDAIATGQGCDSLTSWITCFLCNDDNFGPHLQLPRHLRLGHGRAFVISGLPAEMHLAGAQATAIAKHYLQCILAEMPLGRAEEATSWIGQLRREMARGTVVVRSVAMAGQEYVTYLSNVRDWRNEREDPALLDAIRGLADLPWVWVIELSLPLLTASYYKLGEIVLRADVSSPSQDSVFELLALARLPSIYVMPQGRSSSLAFIASALMDQTPFIGRGDLAVRDREYDVALSFAGEDRAYAEGLAALLTSKRIKVFYDKYEAAWLWGKELYEHLRSVYRDMASFCVVFSSEHYAAKLWTRHELQSAQARVSRENQEYILPVRLDDTEIPGIPNTVGYIDMRRVTLDELAELLLLKLGR